MISSQRIRKQTKDVRLRTRFLGKDGGEFTGFDNDQWFVSIAVDDEEIVSLEPFVKVAECCAARFTFAG